MNSELILRFNSVVRHDDLVYILGDFSFGSTGKTKGILAGLNGKKHLIWGNHDGTIRKHEELQEYFEWCRERAMITVQDKDSKKGQLIVLDHYAGKVWNKRHHGAWQLYGHSHGSLPDDPDALQMDVGVDCNNYYPFSYEDIKKIMNKKSNLPVDHHK